MRRLLKPLMLSSAMAALFVIDLNAPPGLDPVGHGEAIVGAPMTPVSYAGVARRTTRRVVAVEATEATAAAAAAPKPPPPAAPPQPVAAPPPPPPTTPPAGAPAMGTIVATLPQGCTPMAIRGVEYYYCGGVFYRTAFQSNNLVYVVTQP